MLLFIKYKKGVDTAKLLISIHQMLLFIKLFLSLPDLHILHFNTSNVTVYLGMSYLHGLLNYLFQYIKCYCLSVNLKGIECIFMNFNTSNVTVYLH